MAHILDVLNDSVLLCDGGMGSRVQEIDLEVDKDFWGHENCTDILTRSRPDVVEMVHRGYFEAGADMVITNTFGTSPITLGEFGLQDEAFGLSKEAAELARSVADEFSDGRQRFILGDVGPGTKLPSLGHIGYDDLEAGLKIQADGLIAGGVDAILIETCQDSRCRSRPPSTAPSWPAWRLGQTHADHGAGHRGDHRHPAGWRRYRRGGDGR